MISINQALEIDLTGQVNASKKKYNFYSGIGETINFMRGAALSQGGKPIVVIPSISVDGNDSKIVPHLDKGAGVVLTRAER